MVVSENDWEQGQEHRPKDDQRVKLVRPPKVGQKPSPMLRSRSNGKRRGDSRTRGRRYKENLNPREDVKISPHKKILAKDSATVTENCHHLATVQEDRFEQFAKLANA